MNTHPGFSKLRVPHEIRASRIAPATVGAATMWVELRIANSHIKHLPGVGPEHCRPHLLSTSLPLEVECSPLSFLSFHSLLTSSRLEAAPILTKSTRQS